MGEFLHYSWQKQENVGLKPNMFSAVTERGICACELYILLASTQLLAHLR